jgi:hypothetical protein
VRAGFGGAQRHGLAALGTAGDGIRPIGRIGRIAAAAPLQAGGGELLGVAALLDEGLLEGGELLVEQVVGLVNEADDGVGAHGGVGVLEPAGVEGVQGAALGLGIRRIRPIRIRWIAAQLRRHGAHGAGFGAFGRPLGQVAVEEEVFVVEEEFFEAGAGGVEQAQFGLGGGGGESAAFGDVLAAAARGLDHLVERCASGNRGIFRRTSRWRRR